MGKWIDVDELMKSIDGSWIFNDKENDLVARSFFKQLIEKQPTISWPELFDCPECGSHAFIKHDIVDGYDLGWSVGCPRYHLNDGVHERRMAMYICATREDAVQTWNRYVLFPGIGKKVERTPLVDALECISNECQEHRKCEACPLYVNNTCIMAGYVPYKWETNCIYYDVAERQKELAEDND